MSYNPKDFGAVKVDGGEYSPLQVLRSGAGWYIGRVFHNPAGYDEPGTRESGYYSSVVEATSDLELMTRPLRQAQELEAFYKRAQLNSPKEEKVGRTFTVRSRLEGEKVYKGFNKRFSPASEVDLICLVRMEDTVEAFAIDDERPNDLIRYLADEEFVSEILGVYRRV